MIPNHTAKQFINETTQRSDNQVTNGRLKTHRYLQHVKVAHCRSSTHPQSAQRLDRNLYNRYNTR